MQPVNKKTVTIALQSVLQKYAFNTANPTGTGLSKSLTAEKPPAPGPTSALKFSPSVRPPQPIAPKPTGLASATMQAGPNNNNSSLQIPPRQPPPPAPLPQNPKTTWSGWATAPDGLRKDVGDYFTHFLPETWSSGSEAYQSADARYKNLPTDRALLDASRTSATTGQYSGWAAGLLTVAPAVGLGAVSSAAGMAGAPIAVGGMSVAPTTAATAASLLPMVPGAVASAAGANFSKTPGEVAPQTAAQSTADANMPQQTAAQQTAAQQPAPPSNAGDPPSRMTMLTGKNPQSEERVTAYLKSDASDADKQAAAAQHVKTLVDSDPQMKQGLADIHAGNKDTPAARAFQAKVDAAGNDYIKQEYQRMITERTAQTGAPPGPQEQGGFLNQAMQSYQNMPEPMKWMMGIGVGGGLLGLLGGMFGGGGGMGLLGLLGLGAAGAAGAAGGMFGQDAQNMAADAMSGFGKFIGMVPEKLTDEQKRVLLAEDPIAAIKGDKVPTRADAAKRVADGRKQMEQLKWFNSMGGMTPRMLQNMGLSSEQSEMAQRNIGALNTQYADPDSALNAHFRRGEEYAKPTWSSWGDEWRSWLAGKRGCELAQQWAKNAVNKPADDWLRKYRARGQKGRWLSTQRSAKKQHKIPCK